MELGPFEPNTIVCGDCLDVMRQMPDGCIGQVVTSPPFNAGKEYELDVWSSFEDYVAWLITRLTECARLLRIGGWLAIEIADMHVSPEHPHAFPRQKEQWCMGTASHIVVALSQLLYYKAELIWSRGRWTSNFAKRMACAPGSPAVLVQHSKILLFRKPGGRNGAYQYPQLSGSEKAQWCRSVWEHVQPDSRNAHPAPMPLAMAEGLITAWSLPPDVILDPFIGSGTTAVAADRLGRNFFGCDISPDYVKMSLDRISQDRLKRSQLPLKGF